LGKSYRIFPPVVGEIEVIDVEVLTVTVLVIAFQLATKEGFQTATIGE
jgi:hypothetical protein